MEFDFILPQKLLEEIESILGAFLQNGVELKSAIRSAGLLFVTEKRRD